MTENWQRAGFGLYVHWPYCQSKCPYCDFNSHVANSIDQEDWKRLYSSQIARYGEELPSRTLRSIFFGGGTPSLMDPATVAAVIDAAARQWNFANDIEITLEANPSSVEAARFAGFHDAGVNRVSLGIQALNDPDLRALGRLHSVAEARAALDVARNKFQRTSFDLIYARQNQSLPDWQAELTEALSFDPDHLSLYQLTIEPGTAFGDRFARGKLRGLPDEDLGADLYQMTQDLTESAGLPAYEVSNHAKPGAESRHNLIYWQGGDWVGIGPGAHGRLTLNGIRHATETPLAPKDWLTCAAAGNAEASRTAQNPKDVASEYLMMGLRVSDGVTKELLEPLMCDDFSNKLRELADIGLLEETDGHLRATVSGRPVLNAVLRELLPD